MKLKTLVASMALLSLASTGAMAVSQVAGPAVANSGSDFWQGIVYRNQDNNGTMPKLAHGQSKVTGLAEMDVFNTDKRLGFTEDGVNNKSKTRMNLNTAEVYYDWNVNEMTSAHFAVDFDNNAVIRTTKTTSQTINDLSLSEGYVTLAQGNLFLNAGVQYLRFGSASHSSLLSPIAEDLSLTNTTAISGGVFGLNGFYADASIFNGAPYGSSLKDANDTDNSINGYTAEIGYAQNQGVNPFYGYDGMNVYLDYINDAADTGAFQTIITTYGTAHTTAGWSYLKEQHPAVALHAGYVSGPFQVAANYVSVTKAIDEFVLANGSAAKPSSYGVEADYSWNTMNIQTIALSFDGSKDLGGVIDTTSYGPNTTPETRIGLTYGYHINKNVSLQGEYANEKDYGLSDGGTGKSANVFVGRLKVAF